MNATLGAAAVLGVVTAVSGWLIWQSARSRASGAALFLGGALLLIGCASSLLDLNSVTPTAFRLAGALVLPVAVVVYPRPSWRDPLSFVLMTLVGAAGALSVVWPDSFEPMGYVIVSALLVQAWWSFERGDAEVRRALTWSSLAWIGAGLVTGFLSFLSESAGASTNGLDSDLVGTALLVVGPVAMVIGVVRPDLVDVRGLVTRSVVGATVLITYIAAAVGIASTIEAIRGRPLEVTPTIVMCAALAFGVRPLQVMLRGVVDQLLFGDRPDPLAAATSLADRIGDDPALALDAIREALVLPYASLRVGGELLAASGSEVTHTRVLPLRLGEDAVGEIVVGLRAGDLGFSAADEEVLRIVAPLLAQTLRARAMSRDLQRSREAVVTAVEDERRRLRRDLHDGLGPTLSGVAFATDAARNQLRSNPDKADELLVLLRAETAGAITEIRRLVEGLRPPALDELGLVAAVQQHASNLHSAAGTPLAVSVEVQAALPPLPAATEVAAYRIIIEALTNVVRHAEATRAVVELAVAEDALALSVRDDGHTRGDWTPGVGIASMRERSQQVGGTLTATALADGGLVRARIPLLSHE
ncbi:MAG: histidine kinase [Actinomycetota bacterium]|nr:histidine kinase [Actinomycetota bacterium]